MTGIMKTSKRILAMMLPLALFFIALSAFNLQERKAPAKWSLTTASATMAAGDTATLSLSVKIDEGWHTYGIKKYLNKDGEGPQSTEITFDTKDIRLVQNKITTSKPLIVFDSAYEVRVEEFKHSASITLPITSSRNLKPGKYSGNVLVYYQACTDKSCLQAVEVKLPFSVEVLAPSKTDATTPQDTPTDKAELSAPTNQTPPPSSDNQSGNTSLHSPSNVSQTSTEAKNAADNGNVPLGIFALILAAIGAGVVSWTLPCVYPMIPITVSFFLKRSEKDHTKPVMDAAVYSFGIMSLFIILGVVMSVVLGAGFSQDFASHPITNIFLALLFLVFAFNMLGAYELAFSPKLVNKLNSTANKKQGYSGVFLMGMVFSLTSFTCTVGFVGGLAVAASNGHWFNATVGMTVYAAVFALPFFMLAVFPRMIDKLLRSGGWMNNIKVVFGFIEIAFAVSYFARVDSSLNLNILSRELVLAIWAGCGILITLYILGVFKLKLDSPLQFVGAPRATFAIAFATLTFMLIGGMQGNEVGQLEPFIYVESANHNKTQITQSTTTVTTDTSATVKVGVWNENLQQSLAYAKKKSLPVFVDFTGVTCTNCRKMEKNVFPNSEIQGLMQKMVLVRCYTDRRYNTMDAEYKKIQLERFNTTELPLYVLLSPDDKVIATSGYNSNEQEFISFLKKANSNETASLR